MIYLRAEIIRHVIERDALVVITSQHQPRKSTAVPTHEHNGRLIGNRLFHLFGRVFSRVLTLPFEIFHASCGSAPSVPASGDEPHQNASRLTPMAWPIGAIRPRSIRGRQSCRRLRRTKVTFFRASASAAATASQKRSTRVPGLSLGSSAGAVGMALSPRMICANSCDKGERLAALAVVLAVDDHNRHLGFRYGEAAHLLSSTLQCGPLMTNTRTSLSSSLRRQ